MLIQMAIFEAGYKVWLDFSSSASSEIGRQRVGGGAAGAIGGFGFFAFQACTVFHLLLV